MRVLYIASNKISEFSENSNAYQQPFNLCRKTDCIMVVPLQCEVNPEIKESALDVHKLNVSRAELLSGICPKELRRWRESLIQTQKIDCIVSDFSEWSIGVARFLLKKLKRPLFIILWDAPFSNRYEIKRSFLARIEHRVRLFLYNRSVKASKCCFCFINKGVLEAEGIKFSRVIQLVNGIDIERINQVKAAAATKRPFSVCATGRIRLDKGFTEILDAFTDIGNRFRQATLTFVGRIDGNSPAERKAIETRLQNHPFFDRISVTNRLPFQEAMAVVAQNEIGLHAYSTSRYLYWNHVLKVGEYQALGLVPVAVKYPGTSDIIRDKETGVLIPSNSSSDISEAVIRLFRDRAVLKSLAERASYAANERSWDRVTSQMLCIIEKIVYEKD